MIWGFAFKFFFKLWLVGRRFTYGKLVSSLTGPCVHLLGIAQPMSAAQASCSCGRYVLST
jgi:hypothetical protein